MSLLFSKAISGKRLVDIPLVLPTIPQALSFQS